MQMLNQWALVFASAAAERKPEANDTVHYKTKQNT